jgi:cytoskeletal protein CcmA (bactofilin family)
MTEPKTIIGTNTVVNGNIEGDEDLGVEGRLEGAVALRGSLIVEPSGVVHADIRVASAVIRGALKGNIQAEGAVHITTGGRVIGDIVAARVILEDGAAFKGGIDMGDFDIEQRVPQKPEPRAEEPAPAPRFVPSQPEVPEPRFSKRPQPRSRTSIPMAKTSAGPPVKSMAPAPKVRAVGRAKAKKKGV